MPSYILREEIQHQKAVKALRVFDNTLQYVLHDTIRAFALLENSSLNTSARVGVLNSADNDYNLQNIQRALKKSLGERELMELDQSAPREQFR
eukprot:7848762-Lingulodinium_polyedra.AAC.1